MRTVRLARLLYIADRVAIGESSVPITGGCLLVCSDGPVIAQVLTTGHCNCSRWNEFLRNDNLEVELIADPGVGHLSRFTTRVLNDVFEKCKDLDDAAMAQQMMEFPEWKKNRSEFEIGLRDLLEALGISDLYDRIIEDARSSQSADDFFQVTS